MWRQREREQYSQMDRFWRMMDDYFLKNLSFQGYQFTWTNGHKVSGNVLAQLDCCLFIVKGYLLFPFIMVQHLTNSMFNHQILNEVWSSFSFWRSLSWWKGHYVTSQPEKRFKFEFLTKFDWSWSNDPYSWLFAVRRILLSPRHRDKVCIDLNL